MSAAACRTADADTVAAWRSEVVRRVRTGDRFAGLYGSGGGDCCVLTALLATSQRVDPLQVTLYPGANGALSYPSLSPQIPAAFWYERALHDLSGVIPAGHPRPDPLLLPVQPGTARPLPGQELGAAAAPAEAGFGPADVFGGGIFSIPYGPVRSGVSESIEFLVETPGEDIPHLNIRPHFKHRGVAKRFEGLTVDDGVLVAERVEGVASVAHALAFSHAVEHLAGCTVPPAGRLLRVVFAELERVANHLEVVLRLTDAAGLAVATARFSWHKELIMRLVGGVCGNRFGRNVVVPGGVRCGLRLEPAALARELSAITGRIESDLQALSRTASFLDRLRGTGPLTVEHAAAMGALGPIGRASGSNDDARVHRAYDGYVELEAPAVAVSAHGDALARLRVRWTELREATRLAIHALDRLATLADGVANVPLRALTGYAIGWAEAPQGEVLYALELVDGRIRRCFARSASFHNLVLFHDVFQGDVLTDFAFIEASFGLSYAAVAM